MRESVLITAGPTRERIDPVRFISNYSTGTFGYELARVARSRGCSVTLISGPTCLPKPGNVRLIKVEAAIDMYRAVMRELPGADILIMAAAVSDWRPSHPAARKIKRGAHKVALRLVENPDILREAGKRKKGKILVGFALETEHVRENARKKLEKKGLDLVVANRLDRKGRAFGDNLTNILLINKTGRTITVRNKSKKQLAKIILDKALQFTI